MKVGIIGAGKVGCSIGKYSLEHGHTVTGYFSKTKESAEEAATFTQSKVFDSFDGLVRESDAIFITTPDGTIESVWNELLKDAIKGKIVCHFSGSLSSNVFSGIEETGAAGCSIHPMYAFSDRFTSYKKLNTAMFTIEGDKCALEVMIPFFEKMGNRIFPIDSDKKVRYHGAAFLMCNGMIGLYQMGIDMLVDCGLKKEDAMQLVEPMVRDNIKSLLEKGPVEAITGPIERNDVSTVRKHGQVLTPLEKEAYVGVGTKLTEIAKEKHADRDYTDMTNELNNWRQK